VASSSSSRVVVVVSSNNRVLFPRRGIYECVALSALSSDGKIWGKLNADIFYC
jgi:hypothetical protein